jgi:hypothetical protein
MDKFGWITTVMIVTGVLMVLYGIWTEDDFGDGHE